MIHAVFGRGTFDCDFRLTFRCARNPAELSGLQTIPLCAAAHRAANSPSSRRSLVYFPFSLGVILRLVEIALHHIFGTRHFRTRMMPPQDGAGVIAPRNQALGSAVGLQRTHLGELGYLRFSQIIHHQPAAVPRSRRSSSWNRSTRSASTSSSVLASSLRTSCRSFVESPALSALFSEFAIFLPSISF